MARYIDADKIVFWIKYVSSNGMLCDTDVRKVAFSDEIARMPSADVAPRAEWISVEDRLPGVTGRYICAVKDKNGHTWTVAGDYSLEMKTWFGLMFGEIKNTVTHWMPLPEPPKMKGD